MTATLVRPKTLSTIPVSTAGRRANALADRLEHGARTVAAFTEVLTEAQCQIRVPKDGRTIGVTVHHVASLYQVGIQLAQRLAAGQPVTGVTMDDVNERPATDAERYGAVTKEAALGLLRRNASAAATAVRALSDEQLDRAAPVSPDAGAALTCQFVLEDRLIRHSYHQLARIQLALKAHDDAFAKLKWQLDAADASVDRSQTALPLGRRLSSRVRASCSRLIHYRPVKAGESGTALDVIATAAR